MSTTPAATTSPATPGEPPRPVRRPLVNPTYLRIDLRRIARDPALMFFTMGLPGFLFLVFGAITGYADQPIGNGNVAMYVMVSMAAYGAVTATTGVSGQAALEQLQGWGRQLALTPMRPGGFVLMKTLVAVTIAIAPIALVYLLGFLTGSQGTAWAWAGSAAVVLAGSAVFALYGLAISLLFRAESAVAVASGMLVVLAFLGNVFTPLSGTLLTIAHFTPLYGYVGLARYPLTEGLLATQSGGPPPSDPVWQLVLNMGAWTVVFVALALLGLRRSRGRQ